MKLRVRGDSIRLRLTRAEVTTIAEGGLVEESTAFGPSMQLTYALAIGGSRVTASFEAGRLEVRLPPDAARAWATGEAIGIEGAQEAGAGRTLRVLVEKDFACLTQRPNEDDGDAYPNPKASC